MLLQPLSHCWLCCIRSVTYTGWKVKRPVRRLWRGERHLDTVARHSDRNSKDVVAAILAVFVEHDRERMPSTPQGRPAGLAEGSQSA
eukprot:SAG22_NODE_2766_length_2228_cov_1.450446_5_plen_86_part_01